MSGYPPNQPPYGVPPTAQYPRPAQPQVRIDAISEAFNLFSQRAKDWLLAALVPAVAILLVTGLSLAVSFGPGLSGAEWAEDPTTQAYWVNFAVSQFLSLLASALVYAFLPSMVHLALRQLRGEAWEWKDVLNFRWAIPSLIAGVAISIISGFGVCACFVGMFILQGLMFVTIPLIVDNGEGPFQAIATSWSTMRPFLWPATGLAFLTLLIYGILLSTCLGAIVGLPFYALTMAVAYRDVLPSQRP